MTERLDFGCGTAQDDTTRKEVSRLLVALLAPVVYFDAAERFFPVDLASAIRHSALWLVDPRAQPPTSALDEAVGTIDPAVDLPKKSANHYTTVAGTTPFPKTVAGGPPVDMPAPRIDDVYQLYRDGTVGAELSLYATVCRAHEVPNANLFKGATLADHDVAQAVPEGLIVNYYMYFPACESVEFRSEGDWSGISLLLPAAPTQVQDLTDPDRVKQFLPVLACYYHKATDGQPPTRQFVAGPQGFRRWQYVQRVGDPTVGLDTHPVVYVSQGRHNCYYAPTNTPVALSPPWSNFDADAIELGNNSPGPANNALKGGGIEDTPWEVYAAFPPFALLVMCATGCDYPVHFDTSGIPSGYQDGPDQSTGDGYTGQAGPAAGSAYPATPPSPAPPGPSPVNLKLNYVDEWDPVTAGLWHYPGAWGAATLKIALQDPKNEYAWGYYRGVRRPLLAAWFMWNLYLDSQFGCGSTASVTPTPWAVWP